MDKLFLLSFLVAILHSAVAIDCQVAFEAIKIKCNRNYDSEENEKRLKIFCDNYEKIQDFNKNIHDYQKGINCLTDRTLDEINSLADLNSIPKSKRKPSPFKVKSRIGAPTSLDWRDSDIVTSVKDQSSCGSCWAFAAAAICESRIIQNGSYDESLDLSEQYFLECTQQSDCGGGYMEYAMKQATVSGVPEEATYPYDYSSSYNGICSSNGIHCAYENKDYYSLTDDEMIDLLQQGPIAVALASDGWSSYSSGVFSCVSNAAVDHAVVIVGYTSTYWIVKNQWGSSWGINGYIHVTRDTSYNCQIGSGVYVMGESNLRYMLVIMAFFLSFMI